MATEPADPTQRAEAPAEIAEELRRVTARRDELERQILRDPLTRLLNQPALTAQLETELARARRGNYPVAAVALDLDFFKQINDLHGHAVGNGVLEQVAELLSAGIRPGDLCSRVGGDEFVLAFVDSDARLATQIVTRIGTAIAALEFGPGHGPLSFSAGIAEFPRHSAHLDELMEHADRALYKAKAEGRDRICVSRADEGVACAPEMGSSGRHRHNVQNTVEALARAVDARNGYTHSHSHAVAFYVVALARALGLAYERVDLLRRAAVLHDVGKIGVPDAVLWKEGPLDAEEVEIMRRHSSIGHDILLGAGFPEIAEWVAGLHERFDGNGYPQGLAGEEIPIESRMLKVVDAFDAMTSPRLYRDPLSVEDVLAELQAGAGSQFDPNPVASLVALVRSGDIEAQRHGHEPVSDAQGTTHAPHARRDRTTAAGR